MRQRTCLAVLVLCFLALICAGPLLAGETSLSDAFNGKGDVHWAPMSGGWVVRDGAYHMAGTGQTYVKGVDVSDFDVAVDCRILNDGGSPANWVGILFGTTPSAGSALGYNAYLRYSGEVELLGGNRILLAKQTGLAPRIRERQPVRLEVSLHARHIEVSVDGRPMLSYDSPTPCQGQIALATYGVTAAFDNFTLRAQALGNTILGHVLSLPGYAPVAGATVQIYNSMDGYDSPVQRTTVTDATGAYQFSDLPAGEKAYWLRAGMAGHGGTTAWFVSVTNTSPSTADLLLVSPPPHDIFVDSAHPAANHGFRVVDDPQCFGGSRLEVKEHVPRSKHPEWWATFDFRVPEAGDYVPHLAAGIYPTLYYWSDFWWSLDGGPLHRGSKSLSIEGTRYGDRSTLTWAYGAPVHLAAGRHVLKVLLRDPAPAVQPGGEPYYAWSFDAAAFTRLAQLLSPAEGAVVHTSRPRLRWSAPASLPRITVQYSQMPDFSNATVTVGGVSGDSFTVDRPLADGSYYWRIKPLEAVESEYPGAFSRTRRFTVATPNPAILRVRVVSRSPRSATIAWDTDVPCTSSLPWGTWARHLDRTAPSSAALRLHHTATLTDLQPMTYYYFAPRVTDAKGRTSAALRRGFCTPRGVIRDLNSPFGIFGQGLVYSHQLGAAGARWYSDYWDWGTVEPSRGTFNWDQPNERMARACDSDVNLMVTFWGTPPWVRPSHPDRFTYGPDNLDDARNFFSRVTAYCRGRVNWWLPWIEPNVARDTTFGFPEGYWAERPLARTYAAYQRAASEGAKEGNPDCRVVGMNTAGIDLGFIGKCYDEGAADDFDVMNVHYYASTEPFERQDPEAMFARLRKLMSEYGDAEKPIICSEGGGASSGLPGTTEASQADNLIRIYVISIANHIAKLCWTFERDVKPYGSQRVDMISWMGLFRYAPKVTPENPVGQPKPAFYAFKTMTGELYGTEYRGRLALGAGVRAYRFEGLHRGVVVAWAVGGDKTVELPVGAATVTVTDREGKSRTLPAPGGHLKLKLTGSPVFVGYPER